MLKIHFKNIEMSMHFGLETFLGLFMHHVNDLAWPDPGSRGPTPDPAKAAAAIFMIDNLLSIRVIISINHF